MAKPRKKHAQKPAEYRSGFERSIRSFLMTNRIPFQYESRKFKLTLPVTKPHLYRVRDQAHRPARVLHPRLHLAGEGYCGRVEGKFTARDRKIALAMRRSTARGIQDGVPAGQLDQQDEIAAVLGLVQETRH